MGHLHLLLDDMGLDEMGLDEMGINRSISKSWNVAGDVEGCEHA